MAHRNIFRDEIIFFRGTGHKPISIDKFKSAEKFKNWRHCFPLVSCVNALLHPQNGQLFSMQFSNNSMKILQKFDLIENSNFEEILGLLWSDNSWDQACLPKNKTAVAIRRQADQVQVAYSDSVFHRIVLAENLTGHKPFEDSHLSAQLKN